MSVYPIKYLRLKLIDKGAKKAAIIHLLTNDDGSKAIALTNFGFRKTPETARVLPHSVSQTVSATMMQDMIDNLLTVGYKEDREFNAVCQNLDEIRKMLTPVILSHFRKKELMHLLPSEDFSNWKDPVMPKFDVLGNQLELDPVYQEAAETLKRTKAEKLEQEHRAKEEKARIARERAEKAKQLEQEKLTSISGFGEF